MRNYSTTLPSLLFLQQHNSGSGHVSLQSEGLESNQAHLNHAETVFSSGFSYLTQTEASSPMMNSILPPMMNQCSSSNVEEESRHFGQPFQSDMLRDSRKRALEDFVPIDGIFSMISNTTFPVESQVSKRKAIAKPLNMVPARRSQKLSDKITSLQKVVSPYGKTDTASVLQEACMYIKIAHQEIRRLSVSYFGARPLHPQLMHGDSEKWYPDLRSKGLCLVPLAMTSQFSVEDSADVSNSNQGVSKMGNSWGF